MAGYCGSCQHWLQGVTPKPKDWGWCDSAAIKAQPAAIDGAYHVGGAGVETAAESGCSHYVKVAVKK